MLVYSRERQATCQTTRRQIAVRIGSDEVTIEVESEQTAGAILAIEVQMAAGGGPPALHRHAAQEIYRVDRGELTLYLEDGHGEVQPVVAGPGAVVHIPGGRMHTVRNESEADASAYVVFAPGTDMEQFLRAADRLTAVGARGIEEVLALAQRHGIEMEAA
jgi:oxalate decarboxylase/phosphoglucose isomerase-like protein (cupin superfamily)